MFPGPPVAGGEERTVQVAIGQDSEFYRHFFDTVLIDGASKRLHSRGPTNGGARPQTLLDHRKTLFSVCVELWIPLASMTAKYLEKTVLRVLVVGLVLRLGERNLAVVQQ